METIHQILSFSGEAGGAHLEELEELLWKNSEDPEDLCTEEVGGAGGAPPEKAGGAGGERGCGRPPLVRSDQ